MDKIEASLDRIVNRWKEAFGLETELRAAVEPAVVRWEWAEWERYSLLPYYFQRYPGRARALKNPPDSPGYYYCYGLDEQNRPRLHRFYDYLDLHGKERLRRDQARNFERDDLAETFYLYTGTLVEVIEYSVPPRIPLNVQQIFLEDGRVILHSSFRLNGYTPLYSEMGKDPDALYDWLGYNGRFKKVEEYLYEGNRLRAILSYDEAPGVNPFKAEERFSYDEAGKLQSIERQVEGGPSQIVYRKRAKGQTFQSIREAATQKMIAAIRERLRAENIQERLCCIELAYQSGVRHFPPTIFLHSEQDRQRLLSSRDPKALFSVFSPASMLARPRWLEITDPGTLDICSQLEQGIMASGKWKIATKTLRDVAAALTTQDWRGILNTSADFVVYAIDWEMEGDRLEEALKASATDDQIQDWKRKGWL